MKKILLIPTDPMGKWTPNYEGLYVVRNVFSRGALLLSTMDGEDLPSPVNADVVKKRLRLTKKEEKKSIS